MKDVTALPETLRKAIKSVPTVLFVSPLTDDRSIVAWLEQRGRPYRRFQLTMASVESRESFHLLREYTGWQSLPQVFIDGQFVGGIDEFFAHPGVADPQPGEARDAQRWARWLGYGGALPFILLAALSPFADGAAQGLVAYGAVILSFVGALHWTRGLFRGSGEDTGLLLAVSVMPALLAWLALMLSSQQALFLLAAGFVVLYRFDRRQWRPWPWFMTLRLHLTLAAVGSLAVGWLGVSGFVS